jgi:hypothetical protein
VSVWGIGSDQGLIIGFLLLTAFYAEAGSVSFKDGSWVARSALWGTLLAAILLSSRSVFLRQRLHAFCHVSYAFLQSF